MTLRCHRCHRPIKAPAMLERKIVANYGPVCARIIFGASKRKRAVSKVMRWANARSVGDLDAQMAFDGMVAGPEFGLLCSPNCVPLVTVQGGLFAAEVFA